MKYSVVHGPPFNECSLSICQRPGPTRLEDSYVETRQNNAAPRLRALRYGYFGDIGQHERSKDRANRTVESLALIVLYQATGRRALLFFGMGQATGRRALLFFDMGQATGRRALLFSEDNKQHATKDDYCSLRADETREQQPKIRGPRLRTEQD
jgi:hypothetical protein